ncbi:MAG: NUDIX hydrolase [Porticoccaceae bacterium]|nr:NUDIX hydrolase [Porticoccaceae bacterium]
MPNSVHLTVATVVYRNGAFLCVEEVDNGRSVINQPAGHVEAGESLIEAACRETLEETGWRADPCYLLGLGCYTSPQNGESYHRVTLVCEAIERETEVIDPDITQVLWLSETELRERQGEHRSPMVMACIEDYLAGTQYPLEIIRDYR